MSKPPAKILLYDIETSHLKADFGSLLAFGYKWLHEKRVNVPTILDFNPKNAIDDSGITAEANRVLSEADMVVTFYGKGFDQKFLNAKFLEHDLPILANIPHVDLFFTVKSNLALTRKSLANVAYFLQLANVKTPVEGRLWKQAMIGEPKAIKYVKDHCRADVLILEEAYLRLLPLIRTHPRVAGADLGRCRACGSDKLQSRGRHITALQKPRRRVQCQDCASWDTRPMEK